MDADRELAELLLPHAPAIAALASELIATIRDVHPALASKVRFGWHSVNFTHPRTGYICAVFPQENNVLLIFESGRELSSPLLIDNGRVKRVRWIPFRPGDAISRDDIAILIAEAIALRA